MTEYGRGPKTATPSRYLDLSRSANRSDTVTLLTWCLLVVGVIDGQIREQIGLRTPVRCP